MNRNNVELVVNNFQLESIPSFFSLLLKKKFFISCFFLLLLFIRTQKESSQNRISFNSP